MLIVEHGVFRYQVTISQLLCFFSFIFQLIIYNYVVDVQVQKCCCGKKSLNERRCGRGGWYRSSAEVRVRPYVKCAVAQLWASGLVVSNPIDCITADPLWQVERSNPDLRERCCDPCWSSNNRKLPGHSTRRTWSTCPANYREVRWWWWWHV